MHLVIDTRFAFPHLSGIGRYAFNLIEGLTRVAPDLSISALVPPGQHAPLPPAVAQVETSGSPRSPLQQATLPRLLRKLNADLFHCPDAFAPVAAPCPTVITIHDLTPLLHRGPHAAGLKQKLGPVWEAWLAWQCHCASAILTVSEHSRQDIVSHLRVDPAKVSVTYLGIRPPAHANPPAPGNYVLYVGRRDPSKNVANLVRALALTSDPTLQLVIAGHPDPRFTDAENEAKRLHITHRIHFAGHVTDDELDALYRGARALLLLSHYEGFGYTPLEAMARGTPAILSPVTSLPEIAGDAATYANPNDPAHIAKAIDQTASAADRTASAAKGLARANLFTLERQALSTLVAYRSIRA